MSSDQHQQLFDKLKPICVPLLEKSQLAPSSVPAVLRLLSALEDTLRQRSEPVLSTNLVSYVFLPLSTVLRRNPSSDIPDQVMERLLNVFAVLSDSWWWTGDIEIWHQMFMLCSSIVGGLRGKGKTKDRSDETKEAAAWCLFALLRERADSETPSGVQKCSTQRLAQFQSHAHSTQFLPVIGQTVDSLLSTAKSPHRSLQRLSLQLLRIILNIYVPSAFIPSVLPGVVSAMTRIALASQESKGWANGEIVAGALVVIQKVVVISIGDAVCIADGAIRSVIDLEDFLHFNDPPQAASQPALSVPYLVTRSSSWLRASASQIHIALNTLTPLINHPTPSALIALANMAKEILAGTPLTLPQSQPLLLSWLLSLFNSSYSQVTESASNCILDLFSSVSLRYSLLQTLTQIAKDGLGSLPRHISSQADSKVEHVTGQVEAICRLTQSAASKSLGLSSQSLGFGILLGPSGGIERWGWTLLSVLEFKTPPVTVHHTPGAQLFLEGDTASADSITFPEVTFKNVLSRSARDAIERMLRALGRTSGDGCLYAIEWFVGTGRASESHIAVTALWCACRLLEGVSGTYLDYEGQNSLCVTTHSKRLERLARGLARDVAELWTVEPTETMDSQKGSLDDDSFPRTEFTRGLTVIRATMDIAEPRRRTDTPPHLDFQPLLHKAFCLHLLAISANILQANFTPLLVHALYPVLHSVVSPSPHLSLTALATLACIANAASYASPANLLFSHFDYALDAVSHRLGRRWLDVDATKVLTILVRLVGGDVVQKAGDVVEECFDRLDEYHGYEVLVEGLVEVLVEVIKAIETDEVHVRDQCKDESLAPLKIQNLDSLLDWVSHRNDPPQEYDDTNYGPAPQQAWGDLDRGEGEGVEEVTTRQDNPDEEEQLTPAQALAKQMVSRSIYFLTHGSPVIRARILLLLKSATPVLSESALLPTVHQAWPFILNRLGDTEVFVVSAAATLVESLVSHVGNFMDRRIWDDIWPRFMTILMKLETADGKSALARRGTSGVGTKSAYTHSHRLYRSILKTMTAAVTGVHIRDASGWEVILVFRRFLHREAHEELQACARELYRALKKGNEDAVWLALMATSGRLSSDVAFLKEARWDIDENAAVVLRD